MNCDRLPNTGLDASVLVLATVAVACLLAGLSMILLTRRLRGNGAATLLLVVLAVGSGVAIGIVPASPAHAAPSDCANPDRGDNSLTITQTSTMDNLAPGVAPADITGLVVNNGPDSTFITAIRVEIVSVITDPSSPAGTCDASDYVLVDPRMPVGRTLAPGGSTIFTGASIGFSNKSTNQDACQHATIHLRYATVPR